MRRGAFRFGLGLAVAIACELGAANASAAADSGATAGAAEPSLPRVNDAAGPAGPRPAVSASASAPGDPFSAEPATHAGPIDLKVMLQVRYAARLVDSSTSPRADYVTREEYLAHQGEGWRLHRLFLRLGAEPSASWSFKTILDFAELAQGHVASSVKQAYVDLHPLGKGANLLAGVLKLPFSSMGLDPIADYELANLGISDDLIKAEGYAGRDVGAELVAAPLHKPRHLKLLAGAFAGHSHDEHASPVGAVGARVQSEPLKGLQLGVGAVRLPWNLSYQRPFDTSSKDVLPSPPDPFYPTAQYWRPGTATGVDVGLERWHLRVRTEALIGDRTDVANAYGAEHFAALWALVAYRFRAGPLHFMPAARAEWLDAARDHPGGIRKQLSLAWSTSSSKDIRFVLDATRVLVEDHSPLLDQPKPLQADPYLELSRTELTAQLQVQL